MSDNSESMPPRGFLPIEAAAVVLTHGGSRRALTFGAVFLDNVASTQGQRDSPPLRWWQATRRSIRETGLSPLHVHLHDIPGLRDEFSRRIDGLVPPDEFTAPAPVNSVTPSVGSQKYRGRGQDECLRALCRIMSDGPPLKGQDKSSLRNRLKAQFTISGRKFDDIWNEALRMTNTNLTWGRAGRRRTSPLHS
jgi:hypothetical protein